MKSRETPHHLQYGSLERRQLLAGDVFARLDGQDLFVVGDSGDNQFSISLNSATPEQLVQGQEGTSVRFSDDFAAEFASNEILNVFVYSNAGDDTVTLDGRSAAANGRLVVSLGHGEDSLYSIGGYYTDVVVYAGANHDSVLFDRVGIAGDVSLFAGAGMDAFALDSVHVEGVTRFRGQFGHDTLLVNDSNFMDSMFVEMGDGADRYESVDSNYINRFSVRGRQGYDTAMLATNDFNIVANVQTTEVEYDSPNQDGGVDVTIDQLSDSLFDVGNDLRAFTATELQAGMSELATVFNTSFIELELDTVAQTVSIQDPTRSISVIWDGAVQGAVIETSPGPTIASRAYAMMHTAMYDAWSAYDAVAISTGLDDTLQRPESENTDSNKKTAMSFAAYRVLEDLFAAQASDFESLMLDLGLNPNNTSTDVTTPAGIGIRMAEVILAARREDGSNQLGDDPNGTIGVPYSDTTGYTAQNPVGDADDIEFWTPEFVPIDSIPGEEDRIQSFLTPQWGQVESFPLSSGSEFRPEAPQPFLLVDGEVDLDAQTITLGNGSIVDIDSSIVGTIINPEFIVQAEEVVEFSANLTDKEKLIAEFWEDGGGTSFPPGTFMTFGQYVSARDDHSIDQDAQMFFALGNAAFDAGVATWESKVAYDYVRPVRAIRELGELGLIGEYNATLGGYAIEAWSPETGGTETILATDFLTYQVPGGDPSPPFAEYTSGHSAFSAAGATILQLFTGSDDFGGSVTFPSGSSAFEPGTTPAVDTTLEWDTFSAAADEAGESRLFGGIHFIEGDVNGRDLGVSVGDSVWELTQAYINGTV
jgi:hypothetical protein